MKNIFFAFLVLVFASCKKESVNFTLKTIKLNHYSAADLPVQKLYLKVFEADKNDEIIHTDKYSSDLTLPAVFNAQPVVQLIPYAKSYRIELWGDDSGLIGSCKTNMDEYKIIFPLDMEVKSNNLSVSIAGTWK